MPDEPNPPFPAQPAPGEKGDAAAGENAAAAQGGSVAAEPAAAAATGAGNGPKKRGFQPGNPGGPGRGNKSAENARARMRSAGWGDAPPPRADEPLPAAPAPVAAFVFNEAGVRRFAETLVTTVEDWSVGDVQKIVEKGLEGTALAGQSADIAARFAAAAKFPDAAKRLFIEDFVELCRVEQVNVGPGWGILIGLLGMGFRAYRVREEAQEFVKNAPKAA